jgi:eukaryotic-like serine/threonine-protein kinase
MALAQGTRLGPYEISMQIGAGGMGEVYAATDINLARQVAIKVLPEAVAGDPARLARFDREAKTLAALNHPNIASIYGLERSGNMTALVMELVDGPTLADRIVEGAMSLDDALSIARQIAEALEAAHERGIIHRDLKPSNVKVRPDGRVKVLDFGLAKAMDPSGSTSDGASLSPTITTPAMTQAGVILGTAAYMSPEQARGKAVDKRADIWAFGCVLYEMLTGRRVFQDDEVSDTLAYVLMKDPDWSALPPETPLSIQRLLKRCLAKDRHSRLTDIGDARLEIDDARTEPASASTTALASSGSRSGRGLLLLLAAAAVVALAAVAAWLATRAQPADRPVTRALISVAPADRLLTGYVVDSLMGQGRPSRTAMAFAPDGRSIVFTAERNGRVQLYMRRLDQLEATPLAGTEGALNPFFSPNGESLGFQADGALKRIPVSGGAAVTICDVDLVFGASWGPADQIVYATAQSGLWRVPAAGGGKPELVTKPQPGEISHRLPQFLPDGQTVLFTSTKSAFPSWDDTRVVAQSIATGQQKVLIEGGADARYVPTGHLVYMRRGTLMAVPFDVNRLEVTGAAVGLLADVMQAVNIQPLQIDSGAGQFAVAASGALAYASGGVYPQDRWSLVWVDRTGRVEPLNIPRGAYLAPRLSPDGRRIVFNTTTGDWDLLVYDVARGLVTRLPMPDDQSIGVWSPDSASVAFGSGFSGAGKVFIRSADGNGAPEELPILVDARGKATAGFSFPNTWTPDGASLVVWSVQDNRRGLLLVPIKEKGAPHFLFADPTGALEGDFSPDGRWLAYASGGPTKNEVYVRPYPALDRRVHVAGQNSFAPVWRKDGREFYYLENSAGDAALNIRVMAVTVTTTPTFSAGTPHKLFEGPFRADGPFRPYDVTPDGQRFLMVRAAEQPPARVSQMVLVQNWTEELKARAPAK